MLASIAADAVLLLHLSFVLFVAFGVLAVMRWPRLSWLQVPAAGWGVYVELSGRICPLTTIENRLRQAAGASGYDDGFIDHYVSLLVYPPGLTPNVQIWLAVAAIVINVAGYGYLGFRHRRPPHGAGS